MYENGMRIFLFLVMTGAWTLAGGQHTLSSLDQYLESVSRNNDAIGIEELYSDASGERLRAARSSLLPQVKAFGAFDDNISLPVQLVPAEFVGGREGEYAKVQFGMQFNTSFGAEASFALFNPSAWKNITVASLAKQTSAHRLVEQKQNIAEQAIGHYFHTLFSKEAVVLNRELVKASDSLLSAAMARLSNGMIETLEFNRVKAIHIESLQQLQISEASHALQLNLMKYLAGLKPTDSLIVAGTLMQAKEQMPSPDLLIISSGLPGYRTRSSRKKELLEEQKKYSMKVLPEVMIFARYSRQSFSHQFETLSDQPWFDVGVAGLKAEWNLFTGFSRQASIRQSTLLARAAAGELDAWEKQSDQELHALQTNLRVARSGADRYKEHYYLNAENYRIASEKYNAGIYPVDALVTVYRELVSSQQQYLKYLSDYLYYQAIINNRNNVK